MSASTTDSDLPTDERDALELICDRGGIHQSDFWKELDVSSRKGSRLVESLQQAGHIERESVVYNGHTTYYLEPAPQDLNFSLLMAGDMLTPFIGEENIDPQSDTFLQWVMNLAYEEYEK